MIFTAMTQTTTIRIIQKHVSTNDGMAIPISPRATYNTAIHPASTMIATIIRLKLQPANGFSMSNSPVGSDSIADGVPLMATKIIVCGGPLTGKTTIAKKIAEQHNYTLLQTDDLMDMEWSAASEAASHWFDRDENLVIEGVAAVRALRKWLNRNERKKMDAIVLLLTKPMDKQSNGQASMSTAIGTIWSEVEDELRIRRIKYKVASNPDKALEYIQSKLRSNEHTE